MLFRADPLQHGYADGLRKRTGVFAHTLNIVTELPEVFYFSVCFRVFPWPFISMLNNRF
jgi:hypothetical protein